ncbi:MAG: gluconeogenesis factor YvcK family protein [Chloroflexota bacterium]|nr:gluconeogenesis factor YvcK family protein [Chloroflexota bacterium]
MLPLFGQLLHHRWLHIGMGVKRWLLLLMVGITAISIGAVYFLHDLYRIWASSPTGYYLTLQFLPRSVRGVLLGILGLALVFLAIYKLSRSLLAAFIRPGQEDIAEVVYRYRRREHGPKVVAIGGGTGLSILLRGLKAHTSNLTAVVTVADDGGSSGDLRRELGVLPPGDIRNCLGALADDEALITKLFQYRFNQGAGLDGHAFGNLFIVAMAGVTGDFERAVLESSRVLAVQGRILPSTLEQVVLSADLREDTGQLGRVEGESQIPAARLPIERVFLEPYNARAYPGAIQAILEADLICIGPGSLYTSVLPNLLVEDITNALRAARAPRIYICNVATQLGETEGYDLGDHLAALRFHGTAGCFTHVLANDNLTIPTPPDWPISLVPPVYSSETGYNIVTADVIDLVNPWRHDPHKLAQALMTIYEETSC